jgi:hypothetical protein
MTTMLQLIQEVARGDRPGAPVAEVVSPVVWKFGWRILPVGEVHDQPAALAGGHRRNAPWRSVSGKLRDRRSLSLLLLAG